MVLFFDIANLTEITDKFLLMFNIICIKNIYVSKIQQCRGYEQKQPQTTNSDSLGGVFLEHDSSVF